MVADFLGEFRHSAENYDESPPRIVGHFHEWMAGIGLIMCRIWKVCIFSIREFFPLNLYIVSLKKSYNC